MTNFGQRSEHDISNCKYREATWNGKYGNRSHKLGNAVTFLVVYSDLKCMLWSCVLLFMCHCHDYS